MTTEISTNDNVHNQQKRGFINLDHNNGGLRVSLEKILKELNKNTEGIEPKVTLTHIVSFMIDKLNDGDIQKIRQSSYSKKDLIELKWKRHNEENNSDLTLEEYLIAKLKIHH